MFFTARNLLRPELAYYPDVIPEYLNAFTGAEYSPDERVKAGERILNAERMFFIKAGFSRKDDAFWQNSEMKNMSKPRLLIEIYTF